MRMYARAPKIHGGDGGGGGDSAESIWENGRPHPPPKRPTATLSPFRSHDHASPTHKTSDTFPRITTTPTIPTLRPLHTRPLGTRRLAKGGDGGRRGGAHLAAARTARRTRRIAIRRLHLRSTDPDPPPKPQILSPESPPPPPCPPSDRYTYTNNRYTYTHTYTQTYTYTYNLYLYLYI